MLIEGVINHSLVGLNVTLDNLDARRKECLDMIAFWHDIQNIHNNSDLQEAIQDIQHVKSLFSNSDYMKTFISSQPEDALKFFGYDLVNIQFYIDLRNELKGK